MYPSFGSAVTLFCRRVRTKLVTTKVVPLCGLIIQVSKTRQLLYKRHCFSVSTFIVWCNWRIIIVIRIFVWVWTRNTKRHLRYRKTHKMLFILYTALVTLVVSVTNGSKQAVSVRSLRKRNTKCVKYKWNCLCTRHEGTQGNGRADSLVFNVSTRHGWVIFMLQSLLAPGNEPWGPI
jgi:hypothetical protein